jgi:hypothetical protein
MPPPLILSTLPPPLNAQPWPIEAPSPLVRWRLSSRLPLVCRLVVASPVVMCLRLASPLVGQPSHASILNPSSLFAPAGCCVASLRTPLPLDAPPPHDWLCRCCHQCAGVISVDAQAYLPSLQLQLSPSSHVVELASSPSFLSSSTSVAIVVAVVSRRAVAIIINFIALCTVIIVIDIVIHHAIAIVVVAVAHRTVAIVVDVKRMGILWRRRRCPTTQLILINMSQHK